MKKLWILLITVPLAAPLFSQLSVGTWRDHLPYNEATAVAIGEDRVFAATPFSVFRFLFEDNSLELFSKTNGLAESNVTAINYLESKKICVVGYRSGNVDLIQGLDVFNINDIKLSNFVGNKQINDITFRDDKAYLSTGFGIVVLDLDAREVSDTWFISSQNDIVSVNQIVFDQSYWYAATENGIFRADVTNDFLANSQNWTKLEDLPFPDLDYAEITFFGDDRLLALELNGTESAIWSMDLETETWGYLPGFEELQIFGIDANQEQLIICNYRRMERFGTDLTSLGFRYTVTNPLHPKISNENVVWVASQFGGLVRWGTDNSERLYAPAGPPSNECRRLDAYNDNIWVASGGVDVIWDNRYAKDGVYGLVDDRWIPVAPTEGENAIGSINDFMDVAVDPTNNSRVMFGTWEEGLIEVENGVITNIYNEENSPLKIRPNSTDGWIGVGGVDYDESGNLWMTNSLSENPLILRTAGGTFVPMNFGSEIGEDQLLGDVMVDINNYVWVILPGGEGMLVRDTRGTLSDPTDDSFRRLINEEGEGGLPSNDVFCFEEDIDGEIWVGTAQGISVFYAPTSIFTGDNFDAQQILITQDGNVQILLETEYVTCIEIDGSNRKWVGTRGNGVYLFSPDGLEQIEHFTSENSPLLSNNITDIALNQRNGEIFFATENGISSYKGSATNFDQEISSITVYPNPVTADYEGSITIDGLAYQTSVRITDISGNAVFATTSFGGRAIWDGNNFNGERVSTGVYLVFASNEDGSATNIGKVAIVR